MNFSRHIVNWSVCLCRLSALDIDKPETIHVYISVGNSNNDTCIHLPNELFCQRPSIVYPFIKNPETNIKNIKVRSLSCHSSGIFTNSLCKTQFMRFILSQSIPSVCRKTNQKLLKS